LLFIYQTEESKRGVKRKGRGKCRFTANEGFGRKKQRSRAYGRSPCRQRAQKSGEVIESIGGKKAQQGAIGRQVPRPPLTKGPGK